MVTNSHSTLEIPGTKKQHFFSERALLVPSLSSSLAAETSVALAASLSISKDP